MVQKNVKIEPCISIHYLTRGLKLQLVNMWQSEKLLDWDGWLCFALLCEKPNYCNRSSNNQYVQAAAHTDGPK